MSLKKLLVMIGAIGASRAPLLGSMSRYPYHLPALAYGYGALAPTFSTQLLKLHHQGHHQAYVDALNRTLVDCPVYQTYSLEQLLRQLNTIPEPTKTAIRQNGGGHYNHTLFWQSMGPSKNNREPQGKLAQAVAARFGSYAEFKKEFSKQARAVFGSGWVFLCIDHTGALEIISTQQQDCPLSLGKTPLFALDVWEHAYYLQYFNKKADFIEAWWCAVDWRYANQAYDIITHNQRKGS